MEENKNIGNHEERPLITFALFAYNQEQFIDEAVQGALSQTYSPLEIILSDDCSSDRTFDIMSRTANEYQGPHTIILNRNEPNLGLVPHVNKVIMELSHGELIVMAAGDDISLSERAETLWRAWEATDRKAFGISSGYRKIDINGALHLRTHFTESGFIEGSFMDSVFELIGGAGCASAFHRDVFTKFGPLNKCYFEDRNLALRSRLLGGFLCLENVLVYYRTTGMCSSFTEQRQWMAYRALTHRTIYEQLIEDLNSDTARRILPSQCVIDAIHHSQNMIELLHQEEILVTGTFMSRVMAWFLIFSKLKPDKENMMKRVCIIARHQLKYFPFILPSMFQKSLFYVIESLQFFCSSFMKIRGVVFRKSGWFLF